MKNLIKTLVYAVLVLSVVSCRSNDDDFTNKVNLRQEEVTKTIELIPNRTNKLVLSTYVSNTSSEHTYSYKLESMIKRFKFISTKEDKIVKIHYDISFKFETEDKHGDYKYTHIERLLSRTNKLEYNDTEVIGSHVTNTSGKQIRKIYDAKIFVTIYTESGKIYSRLIDKVDVQF